MKNFIRKLIIEILRDPEVRDLIFAGFLEILARMDQEDVEEIKNG